jgi:hypothetical protein
LNPLSSTGVSLASVQQPTAGVVPADVVAVDCSVASALVVAIAVAPSVTRP